MKTKLNNWDVNKKEFYNTVRKRKNELEEIIKNMDSNYQCFEKWYTREHDWRFLRDILGERCETGLPWDYLSLIHLPKINGQTLIGDLNLANYLEDSFVGDKGIAIKPINDPEADDGEKILLSVEINADLPAEKGTGYLKTTFNSETGKWEYDWKDISGLTDVVTYDKEGDEVTMWIGTDESNFQRLGKDIPLADFYNKETIDKKLDGKSTVSVSDKGTSTEEVKYIIIDGVEKKLAGGGTGVSSYNDLTDKPSINGNILEKDKTGAQLGLQDKLIPGSNIEINPETNTISATNIGSLFTIVKNWISVPPSEPAEYEEWDSQIKAYITDQKIERQPINNDYVIVTYPANADINPICDRCVYSNGTWVWEYRFVGDLSGLENRVKKVESDLQNEISRSITKDNEHDADVLDLGSAVDTINEETIPDLQKQISEESERAIQRENEIEAMIGNVETILEQLTTGEGAK